MKKSLGCSDLGISSCTFEAHSEHKEEIKDALFAHAMKYHADKVAHLSEIEQEEMAEQMNQLIQ
jgi:predicted small metal-binding protein